MSDMIAFISFILVATPIIAVILFIRSKNNERKKRDEEYYAKKAAEDHKLEAERRRREEAENRLNRERQRRREIEILLQEDRKLKESNFEAELSEIPMVDIELSDDYINNLLVYEMPDVTLSKPRNKTNLSSYGNFVVIDIETTGVKTSCEIIELSAIRFFEFEPVEAFSTLIKPSCTIPIEATEINGITNEMVSDSPSIKEVMPAFVKFVGKSNLLGHNLPFDLKFVYKYGFDFFAQKRKYYDTLEISKAKLKKDRNDGSDYDVTDYKLTTLCNYYDIFRNNAHRSLSDCYATALLFAKLLDLYDLFTDSELE